MMPCFRFLRSGGEREKRRKRGVFVEVFEVSDEGSAPVSLTLPCFLSLSLSLSVTHVLLRERCQGGLGGVLRWLVLISSG